MIRKKKGEIEWLEFELLAEQPKVVHGVFLRKGGVSLPSQYSSLNMLRGDDPEHVKENRKRVCDVLQLKYLAYAKHTHDVQIKLVQGPANEEFVGFDGLMTKNSGFGLMITHADCQAAIFYDPINHVCANVHAGWRGQVKNIYRHTIEKMQEAFGTKVSNLLVCISPSLGPDHSEFINYQTELPEEFWKFQKRPTYFDLWAISRHQLESQGILPHHIQIAHMDTFANSEDFFSYRREKKAGRLEKITGGHGTIIALS